MLSLITNLKLKRKKSGGGDGSKSGREMERGRKENTNFNKHLLRCYVKIVVPAIRPSNNKPFYCTTNSSFICHSKIH